MTPSPLPFSGESGPVGDPSKNKHPLTSSESAVWEYMYISMPDIPSFCLSVPLSLHHACTLLPSLPTLSSSSLYIHSFVESPRFSDSNKISSLIICIVQPSDYKFDCAEVLNKYLSDEKNKWVEICAAVMLLMINFASTRLLKRFFCTDYVWILC